MRIPYPAVLGSFGRRALMLSASIATAQVLVYAASPVLSRIYSPSDFGVAAAFVAVLGAVGLLGTLSFEMAIPIAENEEQATDLALLAALLLAASSILLAILVAVLPHRWLTLVSGDIDVAPVIYLLPVALLAVGMYGIGVQLAYRQNDFRRISRTRISQSVAQVVLGVGLGLLSAGAWGLVLSRVVGQSAGALSLVGPVIARLRAAGVRGHLLRATAWRFRRFAYYTNQRRYLGDLVTAVPVLFLAPVYGLDEVGLVSLALVTVQLPLNVIGDSVAGVYLADSAKLRSTDPGRIQQLGARLLWALAGVALVVVLALALVGPPAFALVFGEQWREAGDYALLLSGAMLSRFVFKPLSNIFDIFERQLTFLALSIARLALVCAALATTTGRDLPIETTLLAFSGAVAVGYAGQYLVALVILRRTVQRHAMVES